MLDAAGQVLYDAQPMGQGELVLNDRSPVVLQPGTTDGGGFAPAIPGQAQMMLRRPTSLCSPRASVSILISLPNGAGQVTAGYAGGTNTGPQCYQGLSVSGFASAIPRAPTPEPPPDFTIQYVLPPFVAIGETLKYEVVLTNVSGRDIQFTTCPSYAEFLKGEAFLHARYLLNCKPVGLFKSGETVTFAMEFPIVLTHPDGSRSSGPEWTQRGESGLGWVLDLPFIAVNKTVSGQIGIVTLTAAGGG